MKRKQNKKRRNSRPKLTKLDNAIYLSLIVLSTALMFVMIVLLLLLRDRLAHSVEGTIGVAEEYSLLLALPLLVFLFLSAFLFLFGKRLEKIPIFGSKKIKYAYGEEPLFARNRQAKTGRQKHPTRVGATVWCISLGLLVLTAFPCVFTRTTMTEDLRLQHYNAFNVPREYVIDSRAAATVKLFYVYGRGSRYWTFSIVVQTDEDRSEFRYNNFSGTPDEVLETLLALKDRVGSLTVKNADKAEKVIEEYGMTPSQTEKFLALLESP